MDSDALVHLVQAALPDVRFESVLSVDRQPTVYIERDAVLHVLRELRFRPELNFDFLAELTAIDYWPREPRFEVVYIVVSTEHHHRLRVKVRLHGEDAHVADVCGIWPAANWLEREVWDLFGIEFVDHPDPRRLLMPEDWEGFPLRKDYPVQVKLPARVSEPIQVTEQEFRENLIRDRLVRRE